MKKSDAGLIALLEEMERAVESKQKLVDFLQEELSRTNKGLIALTMELEQRVDERTVELQSAREELQQTNMGLLQLTMELESRVAGRTEELVKANAALRQEIAERKRVEVELKASREKYRILADYSHDWEDWKAPDLHYLYVSPACEEICGYSATAFLADPELMMRILHPSDRETWRAHQDEVANANREQLAHDPFSLRIRTRQGEERWIEHVCKSVFDECGNFLGRRGSNRDITERKLAELALRENALRYQLLVDSLPQIIWQKDANSVYLACNQAYAQALGMTPSALIGKTDFDFYPTALAEKYRADDQRIMADRVIESLDERWVTDGEQRYIHTTKVPVVDEVGKIQGTIGIAEDITERKQREEELYASNQINRVTFEQAPIGIAHVSLDGCWLRVNDRFCEIVGYSCEELIERTFQSITYPDDLDADLDHVRQLLAGEHQTYAMDKRYIRKDGSPVWVRLSVSLVREADGKPRHFISLVEDISTAKQLQEEREQYQQRLEHEVRVRTAELNRRTSELESANQDLESFSYSVSHDLRSPLRAIDGFIAILAEEQAERLDDEGKRMFGIVAENARKMGSLIDDILAFSRAGRMAVDLAETDMRALVDRVWADLTELGEGRAIEFRVGELPPAACDPRAIRQVWQNLLANALKFTRGRDPAVIEVDARSEGNFIRYSVQDNGVGFSNEYVGKLFVLFQRLHGMDEFEGTGVGLAIVKRFVQKHGGEVHAEGVPDQGARFSFTLPRSSLNPLS
ncbi:MAG: PAS domain S-box protein [Candidatus Competibacteraceae bacterium]